MKHLELPEQITSFVDRFPDEFPIRKVELLKLLTHAFQAGVYSGGIEGIAFCKDALGAFNDNHKSL